MKILKRVLIAVVIIFILVFGALWFYLDYQSPKYSGEIVLQDLEEKAEVVFDEYGIPHIYAQNERDAYFTLGYVQAQERLFQMELYRRLVQGRASEIFGSSLISTDKYFLTLGLYKLAKEAAEMHYYQNRNAEYHAATYSYLEGINAFINEDRLPVEFQLIGFKPEPFAVEDMYGSLYLTALGFSFAQNEDLLLNFINNDLGEEYLEDFSEDLLSNTGKQQAYVNQLMTEQLEQAMNEIGLPLWEGSNAWVLSGRKTKSGKAILANDTHVGFSQPAIWYEAYLEYPGYEFYGHFLPTVPFGIIGHNHDLAWGLTIFPFDNMDFVQLESIGNPASYIYFQDTLNFEFTDYEIAVKDGESERFTLKTSKLGPVINHIEPLIDSLYTSDIALNWSIYHLENSSVQAIYQMNQAQNMYDFKEAVSLIDIVGLNVMYADAKNNIAWWGCGKIPRRDSLSQSFMFLNSAKGKDKQMGFLSFDENPHMENPMSGFIATANNNPVLSGGSYVPGNYLPSDRIDILTQALEKKDDWDLASCRALQLDHQSLVKRELASFISTQLIDLPKQGLYREVADKLSKWDGNYNLHGIEPTIFSRLYFNIAQQAMADELGPILFNKACNTYLMKKTLPTLIQNETSRWWLKKGSEESSTRAQVLTIAFMMTVDELTSELGPKVTEWKWSKVHTLTHEHPMGSRKPLDKSYNVGPYPVSGGNQVLNKMEYALTGDVIHQVTSGPALRILIDFEDIGGGLNISPTGQSGNFRSPHYQDQAEMFVNGEYRGMLMEKKELISREHQILSLSPR